MQQRAIDRGIHIIMDESGGTGKRWTADPCFSCDQHEVLAPIRHETLTN
jgi:hypothetical protein